MSETNTSTPAGRDPFDMTAEDHRRLAAKTEAEITAAARSDPDNPPLTIEQLARMKPVAVARRVRQKLGMSHKTFAATYDIPLDVLLAWERHDAEPTHAELTYLRAIEREPERNKLAAAE
jgi:putative transcriptional regulator